jgi:hypothetical protein
MSRHLHRLLAVALPACCLVPGAARAHVKWFQPFEVAQPPVSIAATLGLPAFWIAAGLVLGAFTATLLVERSATGQRLLAAMDQVTAPLKTRADRFLLWVLTAFFVALFAIGGTYLTPELRTEAGWVPWLHLAMAVLLAFRRTRPVAAIGIVGVWLLTLREYDLFHLFDYLALGLGVAGYLLLSGLPEGPWHARRFAVLRWGIAVSLMWSSMEKFNYPQWFAPLLEEKPYLALGIPFDAYTTMAGVAEFTLGFGLLWSPLVRRLSAAALFVLMFAAVYPFGRVDLIGHAIILATLIVGVVDPERSRAGALALVHGMASGAPRSAGRAAVSIPAGLAVAFALAMLAYAGAHRAIYQSGSAAFAWARHDYTQREQPPPAGFWRGQEHYHAEEQGALSGPTASPGPAPGSSGPPAP